MKNTKRFMVGALACMMALGGVGCGGDAVPNSATDIQIYYWKSGYGLEFMQEIVNNFNAKQSTYKAHLEYNSNATTITSTLSLEEDNTYDLYFTMLNSMMYKDDFITLDDVLAMTPDGESKTVGEKYNQDILRGLKNEDGTTQFLSYGNGWCGIAYNSDILNGMDYEVPVTTSELESLIMDLEADSSLKSNNVKPWLFFNAGTGGGYWSYPMTAWQVQYDGLDYYYDNLLMLTNENGESPDKELLKKKDGRWQALKVAESLITPTSVHPETTNNNHTKVQTLFLQGKAVMMPNGSWLLNESGESANNSNIKMMKVPVISSIIDVLPDKSVGDDGELAALVRAIDEGSTKLRSDNYSYEVTQADFDRVKEARSYMYNNGAEAYAFIPRYSNAIEGAKEFLKYFYSDEALESFVKHTGSMNCANFTDASKLDASSLTSWSKQQVEFGTSMKAIISPINKAAIFRNTSFDTFLGVGYPSEFSAQNKNDRRTAEEIWSTLVKKVDQNWEEWN